MTEAKEIELEKIVGGTQVDGWDGYIQNPTSGRYYDGSKWNSARILQAGVRVRFTGNDMMLDGDYLVEVISETWNDPLYVLNFKIARY